MRFPGAWVSKSDGGVAVMFTGFDETELSDHSNWTEAWQNEDPSLPAGFVRPAMVIAAAGRLLRTQRPEIDKAIEAFEARGEDAQEGGHPARIHQIGSVEEFGLLCLSLCEALESYGRERSAPPRPESSEPAGDEIPF